MMSHHELKDFLRSNAMANGPGKVSVVLFPENCIKCLVFQLLSENQLCTNYETRPIEYQVLTLLANGHGSKHGNPPDHKWATF